ncbi:MAG: AAA family ATPase [Candidatus Diapherotrites archaeon]
MLQLKKIRMKNFKSFKQVTIPFAEGFTAIAGANGSGKSNIMDAVLFALGETSLKSLRASRLTELVNTGAATGENYAVVTLTLQDHDKQYDISRTVDKTGKSVYRLNEKRVTLGEIQNLLGELGLRVDGHNLVSQGDLLRIIDMNPIERRQLIDEVAGLQEFEEKKGEALKDLEKVDRKIKDVHIVLNERMAIIEQLARERELAKKFKTIEKELQQTKATVLHIESKDLNEKLEKLLARQVDIIEKKEEAMGKQNDSRKSIVELENQFKEFDEKVLGTSVQTRGEGIGKTLETHRADVRVNQERKKDAEKRLAEIRQLKEELEKEMKEHENMIQQHDNITEEGKTLHEKIRMIENELAEHRGQTYAHAQAIERLSKVKGTCPVCERTIDAKHQTKIIEEKKKAHASAQKNVERLTGERERFSKEQNELHRIEAILSHTKKGRIQWERIVKEEKEIESTLNVLEEKQKEIGKTFTQSEKKYKEFLTHNKEWLDKREKVQQKLIVEREKERAWQEKSFRLEGQLSEVRIEQSKYDTRLQDVKEELVHYTEVPTLDNGDIVALRKNIPVLEHQIKQIGTVNLKSLEDFGQYEKDVMEIREKANTLDEERLAVLDLIQGIDVKRTEAFMETFNAINKNFNKLYTGFFDGEARLQVSNPEKPLESGLLIEARHGLEKSLKNIDSMSGGEKSLTSLAFIFAIQLYEPAPFYFFDEVDAALDMTNSNKVGLLIKEMSKSSQFISITHNDQVVKVADQIVGVTKNKINSSVIGLRQNGKTIGFSPASEPSISPDYSIPS